MTNGRRGYARVAILTAIEEETTAVRSACHLTQSISGGCYSDSAAKFHTHDIVNCQVGRGTLVAFDITRDVIEQWQPELLVFCGIAGGINGRDDITVGDIVVPQYIHYCSIAKLSEKGRQERFVPYDHPSIKLHAYHVSHLGYDWTRLRNQVKRSIFQNCRVHTDTSLVSGDKVYGDPTSEEQRWIVENYDDALAIDMESTGVCRAVASSRNNPSYNPRLIVVRCISDLIDSEGNNTERANWKVPASEMASDFTQKFVSEFLEEEPTLSR
jgi:nucleoside phosphorylase